MNYRETMEFLTLCLPKPLGKALADVPNLCELRVRAERPIELVTASGSVPVNLVPSQEQVNAMAESLSEHALYARAEEQRQGFVTLRGGHRMGLCGRVIAQGSTVRSLRDISSFNVRVAGQWAGASEALEPYRLDKSGRVRSLLVVGLPATGKTTILRDCCRALSDAGHRMAIADERSELAACSRGTPQLDVGAHTDVLDGCCKEIALRWLVRSMNPEAIVTDELGSASDVQAVLDAVQSGVAVLASIHGRSPEEVMSRSALYPLAQRHVFDLFAVLDEKRVGHIAAICDAGMRPLYAGREQ